MANVHSLPVEATEIIFENLDLPEHRQIVTVREHATNAMVPVEAVRPIHQLNPALAPFVLPADKQPNQSVGWRYASHRINGHAFLEAINQSADLPWANTLLVQPGCKSRVVLEFQVLAFPINNKDKLVLDVYARRADGLVTLQDLKEKLEEASRRYVRQENKVRRTGYRERLMSRRALRSAKLTIFAVHTDKSPCVVDLKESLMATKETETVHTDKSPCVVDLRESLMAADETEKTQLRKEVSAKSASLSQLYQGEEGLCRVALAIGLASVVVLFANL